MDGGTDGGMEGGTDGEMGGRMDAGWTVGWTLSGCWVDCINIFGTGWSRKVDGMVTEGIRYGHGRWTVSGQNRKN